MEESEMVEIRFHGRGGQGAVVASKILAVAAFLEGKEVQSFPTFGVERRGAPVAAFVRIWHKRIFTRSAVYTPHHIIVLDPNLLAAIDVFSGLKKGGWVLINTPQPREKLNLPNQYSIALVDASGIAVRNGLGTKTAPIVNTAILGAFARTTNIVKLSSVLDAIKQEIPYKSESNLKATTEAYESTLCYKIS